MPDQPPSNPTPPGAASPAVSKRTFASDFRVFFLRGLAIVLPSVITLALIVWAYNFLDKSIAQPINAATRWTVIKAVPQVYSPPNLPEWYVVPQEKIDALQQTRRSSGSPELSRPAAEGRLRAQQLAELWSHQWYLEAIGFVIALVLVYLAGVLLGNYIGRRIYSRVEAALIRLPGIKQVYPNVKQITDFLIGNSVDDSGTGAMPRASKVVLVEYPRKGIWTVGLLTGYTMERIEERIGKPSVTVFIPSSPTPFTGYTITVPAEEAIELPITLDEAIRFVVSGGVLVPPRQKPPRLAGSDGEAVDRAALRHPPLPDGGNGAGADSGRPRESGPDQQ
ncbi:MAG: DUF502 domain-containing protein [Phycisphaerales bacterium]